MDPFHTQIHGTASPFLPYIMAHSLSETKAEMSKTSFTVVEDTKKRHIYSTFLMTILPIQTQSSTSQYIVICKKAKMDKYFFGDFSCCCCCFLLLLLAIN